MKEDNRNLNKSELEVLDMLETAYSGARAMDDESCQVRVARAIAAFKADPEADPEDIFTESFIEQTYME